MPVVINRGTMNKIDSTKPRFVPPDVATLESAVQRGKAMANTDNSSMDVDGNKERENKKRTASLKNDEDYDNGDENGKMERDRKRHKSSLKKDSNGGEDSENEEESPEAVSGQYQANVEHTLADEDQVEQELEAKMQEAFTAKSTAEGIINAYSIADAYVAENREATLTVADTIAASIPSGASDITVLIHIGDSIYNYGNTLRLNDMGNFVYLPIKIETIKEISRIILSSLTTIHDISLGEDEIEAIVNNRNEYLSPYVCGKKKKRDAKRLYRLGRVAKGFPYA
jgi:hypothetical protein